MRGYKVLALLMCVFNIHSVCPMNKLFQFRVAMASVAGGISYVMSMQDALNRKTRTIQQLVDGELLEFDLEQKCNDAAVGQINLKKFFISADQISEIKEQFLKSISSKPHVFIKGKLEDEEVVAAIDFCKQTMPDICVLSFSSSFFRLPREMQDGVLAHEAMHFECDHIGAQMKLMALKNAVCIALIGAGSRITITLVPVVYAGMYFFEKYESRKKEKEADLKNKTPEELLNLARFFITEMLFEGTLDRRLFFDSDILKKIYELKATHPSCFRRIIYLIYALQERLNNPQSGDIPSTADEIYSCLQIFLEEKTLQKVLIADDMRPLLEESAEKIVGNCKSYLGENPSKELLDQWDQIEPVFKKCVKKRLATLLNTLKTQHPDYVRTLTIS